MKPVHALLREPLALCGAERCTQQHPSTLV